MEIRWVVLLLLIAAHLTADYVLQPDRLVKNKWLDHKYSFLHAFIFFAAGTVFVWGFLDKRFVWGLAVLALTHAAVDIMKIETARAVKNRSLELGIIDQLIHLGLIALIWHICTQNVNYKWTNPYLTVPVFQQFILYGIGFLFMFKPARIFMRDLREKVPPPSPAEQGILREEIPEAVNTLERLLFFVVLLINQWIVFGLLFTGRVLLWRRTSGVPAHAAAQILEDAFLAIAAALTVNALIRYIV